MKKTGINKNVIMLCECAVMVALATVSVSYTHLDVYKRQILHRRLCIPKKHSSFCQAER